MIIYVGIFCAASNSSTFQPCIMCVFLKSYS